MLKFFTTLLVGAVMSCCGISQLYAAAISYTVIQSTATSGVSVVVNELNEKRNYDCFFEGRTCVLATTTPVLYATSSIKIISLEEATTALASKEQKPDAPVSTILDTNQRLPLMEVPKGASFVAGAASSSRVAFYTTQGGGYSNTSSRTYWVFDKATKETTFFAERIPVGWDLISDLYHIFSWSPDGKHLVYASDRSGAQSLYLVDVKEKLAASDLKGKQLIARQYTVADFVTATTSVFYIANRDEPHTWNLYELPFDGLVPKLIDSNVMYTNELILQNGVVVYTKDEAGRGVLKGYDTAKKEAFSFGGVAYGNLLIGKSEIINKPFKGVVLPSASSTDTALIWLHGGPYRQTAATRHSYGSYALYDWMLELVRAQGVLVVKSDYPGSYGFGVKYANSLVGQMGVSDMKDIKAIIIYLKKKGIKHIYISGVSYGGYLTLKAIEDLPTTFDGAIAIAPVTDWKKLLTDVHPSPFEVDFQAKDQTQKDKLFAKSSTLANRITNMTPTILVHGSKDTTVPQTQSFHYLIESKGIPAVSMISLEGEKHVLAGPSQIEEMCRTIAKMIKRNPECSLSK
jgi:dipeptidyl aminopeptidase/acylaminoacyl peptidase